MQDYKSAVQAIADDLAERHYEGDYFGLSRQLRCLIWKKAERSYADKMADSVEGER